MASFVATLTGVFAELLDVLDVAVFMDSAKTKIEADAALVVLAVWCVYIVQGFLLA
jgi:hypothetical protein